MDEMLRRTGIDVLGDCAWGTHFCVFYRTPRDLLEVLVPYFKAGLEDHELCMWITSEPLPVEAAKQALQDAIPDLDRFFASGQLEILDYRQWYTLGGSFDSDRVLEGWIDKLAEGQRRAFTGLRLTGNTFWLEKDDWRAFTDYEASVDRVIGSLPMMGLCTYSLDRCGASEVLDVVANHQFALARREGKWEELQSAARRRSKEQLQRAYAELEDRIKARTAELELDKASLVSRESVLSDTATRLRDEIVQRTRVEADLRRASLYVRSLIEASLDPLVTISPAGKITDVNLATETVTGLPRQQLIGTDFSDHFTEPEQARLGYRQVLAEGLVCDYPLTIRHPSGRTIDVLYNASVYRNEAGALEGVFAAARDITERKRAEQLSVAQARQQAAVAELGQLALAGVDADTLMVRASALVTSTLGVEFCKVLELLPNGTEMRLRAGTGWEPSLVGTAIVPATPDAQAGYVLRAQRPIVVEDLCSETRFTGAPLLHDHGIVSGVSVLIAGPNRPFGVLGAHTRRHRTFTQDDVNFLQATANVIATAIQRSDAEEALRQAHDELEARVEERTRELAALLEISRDVAAEVLLDPLLATILAQLKTVLDYTHAGILTLEGDFLRWVRSAGPSPASNVGGRLISLERSSPLQQVASERRPLIIGDVRLDRAWSGDAAAWGVASAPPGAPLRSWLGVPLVVKGELIGVLSLDYSEPNHFTEQHARLALAFADHAAVAIQNARLYEQAHELAAIRERQRLARELHDSVSQSLYAIVLAAHTALAQLDGCSKQVNGPLEFIVSMSDRAFADMRALIFELRPDSLATAGLLAGITQQVEIMRKRYGMTVDMDLCAEPQAPSETKEMLYRVAQEALTNVAKHARATKVELRLSCADDALLLELKDNGQGFDSSESFPGHLGLRLMRERVEQVAGILAISSSPGAGTQIRARVPLLAA